MITPPAAAGTTQAAPQIPVDEAFGALRQHFGVGVAALRPLFGQLAQAGPHSLGDLVEACGLAREQVLDALRLLGVPVEGDQVDVGAGLATALAGAAVAPVLAPTAGGGDLLATIAEVAAGLPPSLWDLDHVPATAETIVARARHLAASYDLSGAHLVCLGDHDLTSVATALLVPDATLSVVDVDERLLEYLDGVSQRLDLGLHLYAGDLRAGLPRTLREAADVVFCDPPYSQEGIGLFVRRSVEALSDRPGAAVLFCYGAGDRGAERMLAVQDMLAGLRLAVEALLPGFNRYHGAHAIGARSALWVCRPTRRTRPAVAGAESRATGSHIYSRGAAAVERPTGALPVAVLAAVHKEVRASVTLVGEGWGSSPDAWPPGATGIRLQALLDAATEVPRPAFGDVIAVNLSAYTPGTLLRVLLAAPSRSTVLLVAGGRALAGVQHGPLRRLVESRFRLSVRCQPQGTEPGLLVATPASADPAATARWMLRYLLEHQAARLRNSWREALCNTAARQGATMTKNEARARVEASPLTDWELDARLLELPVHRLAALVEAVEGA